MLSIVPTERPFDIILFGATGFTGRLVAEYLAGSGPKDLRWAIAGRNRNRLAEVKATVESKAKTHLDIIEADTSAPETLDALARNTRVLISTVGPYCAHGFEVVKACVKNNTDYVDITGEPEFVDKIRADFDTEAQEKGLRIVNCCGFDSVPYDLGVLFTVKQLPQDGPIDVDGFLLAHGELSGGTWQSAIGAFSRLRKHRQARQKRHKTHSPNQRKVRSSAKKIRYDNDMKRWAIPFPTIDPEIVCRSAKILPGYGTQFSYGHYVRTKSVTKVIGTVAGAASLITLSQIPPARSLLRKFKKSGQGPSEAVRAESWFSARFVGRAGTKKIITEVRGGDPGYTETAKMLGESALCIAFDRDQLPDYAGILTPAVAMGEALIDRLISAGISFETIETKDQ